MMNNSSGDSLAASRGDDKTLNSRPARPEILRLTSEQLLQGASHLIIEHDAFEYHLRVTSNGKLILTK
ncbi:MAG: hemin uptake protein HemP [Chromatiales bacterium]|nr:hemin uptake protein HemP [Chromatiales bacterium]